VQVAADVAPVAVLGDELEGYLLTFAADPDRGVRLLHGPGFVDWPPDPVVRALEPRLFLGPHPLDDLQSLAQHAKALRSVGILVAVGVVLVPVPAGAYAEDEPAAAHHVDAARHLGQQRRRAVAVAGHHLAKPHSARVACEC